MTATTPPPDLPFGPDTDEAVSALVDGELAAFAAAHDTTESDARDRLEAWPGFANRRAALEGARASVAAPVDALDDVTRRRLVDRALREHAALSPARRDRRTLWTVVGAVAASLLVVVGIGLAINASSGGSDSTSSSGSATAKLPDLRGDLGDVGDVSTPAALRALLEGRRTAAGNSATSGDATGGAPAAPEAGSDTTRTKSPAQCAAQLAGDRDVTFVATGTFRGRAATIVGLAERGRTIAFVVASDDCTDVLASLSR